MRKCNSKYKQTNLKENLSEYQTSEQENIRVPFVKGVFRIICDHSFFPYKSAKMRIDSVFARNMRSVQKSMPICICVETGTQ